MTTGHLQIHSENILPIIKKWLYSDKDIFVRELVANACDALHKLKILSDKGEASFGQMDGRIDIKLNKADKTLRFIDNGIGMTGDEVVKYIAQIAFSGAEDFVEKYQTNREGDQFIGHFGLGFYSAYMVADTVDIDTLSYREGSEAVLWRCDGSPEYTLDKSTRSSRGTSITLHVGEDSLEYLDEGKMSSILRKYCGFLQYPIYFNDKLVNPQAPLWIKNPSECTKGEYLEFYRHLYPMEEDPLFWIHLNVDYPFHLKGILYFPKLRRHMDPRLESIQLYSNRVFVADTCKDILPDFLMVLRGVIDSGDMPLNVSRSTLQMDRTVRQVSGHISKKVADSLLALFKTDRERYVTCWPDIEVIVKLGAMQDDKFFAKVRELMIWKTTDGSWTTLAEYLERNKEKGQGKIFYTADEKQAFEFVEIYHNQGIEVLHSNPFIDSVLMSFLERQDPALKFQRIDGGVDNTILDASREKKILDAEGKTEATRLADFIRSKLDDKEVEVEAKSLASNSLPAFILIDEQQRRVRDYLRRLDSSEKSALKGIGKHTFVVNTNNGLMSALRQMDSRDPTLTKEIVKDLYELSLLSQREINAEQLNEFIQRTSALLQKLTERLVT